MTILNRIGHELVKETLETGPRSEKMNGGVERREAKRGPLKGSASLLLGTRAPNHEYSRPRAQPQALEAAEKLLSGRQSVQCLLPIVTVGSACFIIKWQGSALSSRRWHASSTILPSVFVDGYRSTLLSSQAGRHALGAGNRGKAEHGLLQRLFS